MVWSQLAEFVPDFSGVGMVQVIKDFQGLLPATTGLRDSSAGLQCVAEAAERVGLVVAVAKFRVKLDGALVAVGGLSVLSEMAVSVAETV